MRAFDRNTRECPSLFCRLVSVDRHTLLEGDKPGVIDVLNDRLEQILSILQLADSIESSKYLRLLQQPIEQLISIQLSTLEG